MTGGETLFETPRLRVRRLTHDDVDALIAVYGDADAMRWVGDGQALSREQCAEWVEVTHRNYASRGYGMSALVDRETGHVLGFCGVVHPGGQPEPEIKYALRREVWGRGIATEAAAGMLDHAARTFGMDRIHATTDPDNLASHRVLGKAGMQRGELRREDDGSLTQVFVWERPAT